LLPVKITLLPSVPQMGMRVEPVDELTETQQRARLLLDDIERQRERQVRERREGRKQAKLDPRLVAGIKACTPKQLKEVMRVVRNNLRDYKRPPELRDIRLFRNSKLLAHAPYKNKLYCMELHPCGKANCQKCPHGPYYIAYQRDGRYYRPKSEPNFSKLPKPIREAFEPIRAALKKKAAGQT
jgi:hypothetical protein